MIAINKSDSAKTKLNRDKWIWERFWRAFGEEIPLVDKVTVDLVDARLYFRGEILESAHRNDVVHSAEDNQLILWACSAEYVLDNDVWRCSNIYYTSDEYRQMVSGHAMLGI